MPPATLMGLTLGTLSSPEKLRRIPITRDPFQELDERAAIGLLRARYRALEKIGLDTSEAALLAARLEVDVNKAVSLLRRACPVPTALRILL